MKPILAALGVPMLLLAACNMGGGGSSAPAAQAPISRPDANVPRGFDLYIGHGDVRELHVDHPTTGGTVISYSIIAEPREVIDHYERLSTAAGMHYAGRLDAGDQLSYDARNDNGSPRTMTVTATKKAEYTNVSLYFDVTR